jgi:cation diffusion facilitator family transporter
MKENEYKDLKIGENAAKYSTMVNIFLTIIKGVIGLLSGSIALLADAIHSFSDIFASFAVFIGLKLSQREPDDKFPYGYYKFETLSSLIISVIIIISGLDIIIESINSILVPKPLGIPLIAILVSLISVAVSFYLAKYKDKIGNKIGSQALINDGKHSYVDVFSSIIVFIGILSAYIGYPVLQGFAGLAVALLIIFIGLKFGKEAILVLLDANLDPKTVEKIKSIAINFEGVKGVHDVKVRRSGTYLFADLHLETEKKLSIQKADDISKSLENKIKNEIIDLDNISIKLEPKKKQIIRIALPIDKNKGLNSNISKHFGKAPYFLIADVDKYQIKEYNLQINTAANLEEKRGLKTVKLLKNEEVDVVLFNGVIKEGPSHALSDELIEVVTPNGKNLREMLLNTSKSYNNL